MLESELIIHIDQFKAKLKIFHPKESKGKRSMFLQRLKQNNTRTKVDILHLSILTYVRNFQINQLNPLMNIPVSDVNLLTFKTISRYITSSLNPTKS